MTIGEKWVNSAGRSSGFDYLRLYLAISVLLWHSYPVSHGFQGAADLWATPVSYVVQLILPAFFALSGFLVSGSLVRVANIKLFLGLRFLRLFPALCTEVLLSAFVFGTLLTKIPLMEYFSDHRFFLYMLNIVGWPHFDLPGLFKNNPVPFVNVSLWTIPFELECYIAITLLALFGLIKRPAIVAPVFAILTIGVWIFNYSRGIDGAGFTHVEGRVLVLSFMAGAVIFFCKDRIPYSVTGSIFALIASAMLMHFDHTVYLAPLLVAYFVAGVGLLNPRRTFFINSGRDYSYGVYLYAFPIQQVSALALGSYNNWITNVLIALPATLLMASFSWHCIEKPMLRFKKLMEIRFQAGKQRPLTAQRAV
jgi:peptidoglycan/LPS O-acetylase OafA/YrhL